MQRSGWVCAIVPLVGIGATAASILLVHRRAKKAAAEWAHRSCLSDAEFLAECDVPAKEFDQLVALAARREIASLATVPAETIRPEHLIQGDLGNLPFWDSLDWLGFVLEVERESGYEVRVPGNVAGGAAQLAGGYRQMRVGDLVRSVVTAAFPNTEPKETLLSYRRDHPTSKD